MRKDVRQNLRAARVCILEMNDYVSIKKKAQKAL